MRSMELHCPSEIDAGWYGLVEEVVVLVYCAEQLVGLVGDLWVKGALCDGFGA